ncbi:MAG: PIN domain-containing protein [Candidatus Omnitrophota bacterium]
MWAPGNLGKDEYLQEIVKRAIYRVKPCTERGEEFRDVLLWLTVLDIARLAKNDELIFISNNIHQFSDGKNSLHSDLFKETENAKLQIKYYQSLDQFIEAHAVKIDFITKDWLSSVLDVDIIDKEIIKMLEMIGEEKLLKWAANV